MFWRCGRRANGNIEEAFIIHLSNQSWSGGADNVMEFFLVGRSRDESLLFEYCRLNSGNFWHLPLPWGKDTKAQKIKKYGK